jgi:hypothetical protein
MAHPISHKNTELKFSQPFLELIFFKTMSQTCLSENEEELLMGCLTESWTEEAFRAEIANRLAIAYTNFRIAALEQKLETCHP